METSGGPIIAKIFNEALQHNSPGFALGEKLAKLFADRYVLEHPGEVELDSFVEAGHMTVAPRSDLYNQYDSDWSPEHDAVYRSGVRAWHIATWQGTSFDVITIEWVAMYPQHRTYVIGTDRAQVEAFFAALSRWNHEVRGEILVFTEGCFQKSRALFDAIQAARFDQLVLEGSFKEQIRDDFRQFLSSRALYEEAGVPWRRGALFIGPPGNGKTMCVKALVNDLGIPCLYIQSFDAQYGTPQRSIDAVFSRARKQAPCIMVLEDIDALLTEGSRSLFLNALDGFASNAGVITLATTNHPERLDPSIVERPSRFDRKYHFDLPGAETRARYVDAWNERLREPLRLRDEGCAQLAEATDGFSFAYIQEVFVASTMQWMGRRDGKMLEIALAQVELLREQMTRMSDSPSPPPPTDGPPVPPEVARMMRAFQRRR